MTNETPEFIRPRKLHWKKLIGIIVAAVAFAASAISVYNTLFERKKWEVTLELLSSSQLLDPSANMQSQNIKVYVNDQLIEDPSSYTFRLTNSGNQPLRQDDIDRPLTVTFSDSTPLKVVAASTTPLGIHSDVAILDNSVTLSHGILNSGNSITFTILSQGHGSVETAVFRSLNIDSPVFRNGSGLSETSESSLLSLLKQIFVAFAFIIFVSVVWMALLIPVIWAATLFSQSLPKTFARLIPHVTLLKATPAKWQNIRRSVTIETIKSKAAGSLSRELEQGGIGRWELELSWIKDEESIEKFLHGSKGMIAQKAKIVAEEIHKGLRSVFPDVIAQAYTSHQMTFYQKVMYCYIMDGFARNKLDIESATILDDVDSYIKSGLVR